MSAEVGTERHRALLALAAPGTAFPRDPASNWGLALAPLAAEHGRVEASMDALLVETDPGRALNLLPDYERVLGDDPCLGPSAALPVAIRQSLARQRWTVRGGATPAFFVALAASLGVAITVRETIPPQVGAFECGSVELMGEDAAFEWVVNLPAPNQLVEFEVGVTELPGPLGDFVPSVVECVIRRHAPAHTAVFFSYGGT